MISGLGGAGEAYMSPLLSGMMQVNGPQRPDFNSIDTNKSGGLSVDELKTGISSGEFSKSSGPGGAGGLPSPPPGGGAGGAGGGQAGEGTTTSNGQSVAATILEQALQASAEDSETAIQALFDAMDADADGEVTGEEFGAFGESLRSDSERSVADMAASKAAYSGYTGAVASLTDLTALASQATSLQF